jgi:type IV pilus assembly protein PilF
MLRVASSLFLVSTLLLAGCANWKPRLTSSPVTESRAARHQAAVQAFEEHRQQAELESAIDRWSQGDIAGCESRVRSILARSPSDTAAHVLLAELAWSMNDTATAEAEYLTALRLAPERADIEHALGLLLGSAGRATDAAPHLARAAQLDPQNELYSL